MEHFESTLSVILNQPSWTFYQVKDALAVYRGQILRALCASYDYIRAAQVAAIICDHQRLLYRRHAKIYFSPSFPKSMAEILSHAFRQNDYARFQQVTEHLSKWLEQLVENQQLPDMYTYLKSIYPGKRSTVIFIFMCCFQVLASKPTSQAFAQYIQ